jgi:hypothetical protein
MHCLATWRQAGLSIANQSQKSIELSALLWLVQSMTGGEELPTFDQVPSYRVFQKHDLTKIENTAPIFVLAENTKDFQNI